MDGASDKYNDPESISLAYRIFPNQLGLYPGCQRPLQPVR